MVGGVSSYVARTTESDLLAGVSSTRKYPWSQLTLVMSLTAVTLLKLIQAGDLALVAVNDGYESGRRQGDISIQRPQPSTSDMSPRSDRRASDQSGHPYSRSQGST